MRESLEMYFKKIKQNAKYEPNPKQNTSVTSKLFLYILYVLAFWGSRRRETHGGAMKDPEFSGAKQKNALVYLVVQLVAGFLAGMATGFLYGFGEVGDVPALGPNFGDKCFGDSREAKMFPKTCYDGAWIGAPLVAFSTFA